MSEPARAKMDASARALLAVLDRFGVDYVMVGGVAMQAHGVMHVTNDVDVVISLDPATRGPLGQALEALRAEPRGVGNIGQSFSTPLGQLDILDRTDGMGDYDAWRPNARELQLGDDGPVVRVGSLQDIKHDKTLIDREKDRRAIAAIERYERGEPEPKPPPAELLLGPRPQGDRSQQRQWDVVARMVDRFRERHSITSPEPLGGASEDPAFTEDRERILRIAEAIAAAALEPDLGEDLEI